MKTILGSKSNPKSAYAFSYLSLNDENKIVDTVTSSSRIIIISASNILEIGFNNTESESDYDSLIEQINSEHLDFLKDFSTISI